MRKIFSALVSGVMLTSFVLCGCQNTGETSEPITSETETKIVTTTATESKIEINRENFAKVRSYMESNNLNCIDIYVDGIRGGGYFYFQDECGVFGYTSNNGDLIKLTINPDSGFVDIYFDFLFDDATSLYGINDNYQIENDEIEQYIDDLIANKSEIYMLWESSALTSNADNIKKVVPVYYSRFITLADKAFSDIGLGLEDLGIDLGDKYRSVDPTQTTLTEPTVKNDHKFVKGFCSDCDKTWTEYFNESLRKFDKYGMPEDWITGYGQKSSTMFSSDDYVMFSMTDKNHATVYYHHAQGANPTDYVEGSYIYINNTGKKIESQITFELELKETKYESGSNGFKYYYLIIISAKDGDYYKLFESKDAFKKNAKAYLFVRNSKGSGTNVMGRKKDKELKKMFDKDGCTYYTKEQILDRAYDDMQRMLASVDSGMVWHDTSLAEAGIIWKKPSETEQ